MTKDELIARIEEAHAVLRRLPDPERRFLSPKQGSWPMFVREQIEGYGWSDAQVRLGPPDSEAIDRAEELLGWFATHLNAYPVGAKVIWFTYGRGRTLREAGVWMGRSHTFVWKAREAAMSAMLHAVSKQCLRRAA